MPRVFDSAWRHKCIRGKGSIVFLILNVRTRRWRVVSFRPRPPYSPVHVEREFQRAPTEGWLVAQKSVMSIHQPLPRPIISKTVHRQTHSPCEDYQLWVMQSQTRALWNQGIVCWISVRMKQRLKNFAELQFDADIGLEFISTVIMWYHRDSDYCLEEGHCLCGIHAAKWQSDIETYV